MTVNPRPLDPNFLNHIFVVETLPDTGDWRRRVYSPTASEDWRLETSCLYIGLAPRTPQYPSSAFPVETLVSTGPFQCNDTRSSTLIESGHSAGIAACAPIYSASGQPSSVLVTVSDDGSARSCCNYTLHPLAQTDCFGCSTVQCRRQQHDERLRLWFR